MSQFEKMMRIIKTPMILITFCILMVCSYFYIDRAVAIFFHNLDLGVTGYLLNGFTLLGQWIIYSVLLLAIGLYFKFIKKNRYYETQAWYLLACMLVANGVSFLLKVSLGRARPDLLFFSNDYGFYGIHFNKDFWSFPSGHTTTIISLALGIGILYARLFWFVLSLAFLVAATRVILYRHYLSDVLVAFYLTTLVTYFLNAYLNKKHYFNKAFMAE